MNKKTLTILIIVSIVGFTAGYLTVTLPCNHCEAVVLEVRTHKILGEHYWYCPKNDH